MSSDNYSKPYPAACLSEEAMDLICSFVREIEDDREMANTLCALSLSSRRWTSPAVRALYFDPTRSLARCRSIDACYRLTANYLKKPGLGAYARELSRLPLEQDLLYYSNQLGSDAQVEAWVIGLVRACPKLSSISIPAGGPVNWAVELPRLSRLRHLTIEPAFADNEDIEVDNLSAFLRQHKIPSLPLRSLTLSCVVSFDGLAALSPDIQLRVDTLELTAYELHINVDFPLRPVGLKHLCLEPYPSSLTQSPNLLVPSLESLVFVPMGDRTASLDFLDSANRHEPKQMSFPFHSFPSLPNLRHLTLEFILVPLPVFNMIARRCPKLESLNLSYSLTFADLVEGDLDLDGAARLDEVLDLVPRLNYLNLGYVPVYLSTELQPLRAYCDERGITLIFKVSSYLESSPSVESCASSSSDLIAQLNGSGYRESIYDSPQPASPSPADASVAYFSSRPYPSADLAGRDAAVDCSSVDLAEDDATNPGLDVDFLFSLAFSDVPTSDSSPSPFSSRSSSPGCVLSLGWDPQLASNYRILDEDEAEDAALDLGEADQDGFDAGEGEAWKTWEGMDELEEGDRRWREGEGTTYAPVEEWVLDEVEEEVATSELEEHDVEAAIEEWRTVEAETSGTTTGSSA